MPERGPFANERDQDLEALGVPAEWIEQVKFLRSEDDFVELFGKIPDEAWERLAEPANGKRPTVSLQRLLPAAVDPFEHPDARRRFVRIREPSEIASLFSDSWERWQVFLHPSQRAAVEADHAGPALVSGGAGTGKSVVAVHRAVWLARRSEKARILPTTFSRNLAIRLSQHVDRLVAEERVRTRIEVTNLDRKLRQLARHPLRKFEIVTAARLLKILQASAERGGFGRDKLPFIAAERERVVDFWGIDIEREYVEASRDGRAAALGPAARLRLWPVFARAREELRERGLDTWAGLAGKVAAELARRGRHPFNHVIVDEAQDLRPQQLRAVRQLVAPGRNDILIVGDWGQQIYKPRYSWMSAGIDVRGRSTSMKVCYRTTSQILNLADRVWFANGPREPQNVRDGLAVSDGPVPRISGDASRLEEIEAVREWLAHCRQRGLRPEEIAVLARTKSILREVGEEAVRAAGLEPCYPAEKSQKPQPGQVSLLTMHGAKGIEFRAAAIVGCSREAVPSGWAMREANGAGETEDALRRERNLLYVALTRPRELLLITWSGEPSIFLEPLLERGPTGSHRLRTDGRLGPGTLGDRTRLASVESGYR